MIVCIHIPTQEMSVTGPKVAIATGGGGGGGGGGGTIAGPIGIVIILL